MLLAHHLELLLGLSLDSVAPLSLAWLWLGLLLEDGLVLVTDVVGLDSFTEVLKEDGVELVLERDVLGFRPRVLFLRISANSVESEEDLRVDEQISAAAFVGQFKKLIELGLELPK